MVYFILSKVMSFLINPMFWILSLLLLDIFSRKRKRQYVNGLLVIILVFGNSLITNFFVQKWEHNTAAKYPTLDTFQSYIILGGYNQWNPHTQMQDCNAAGDRLYNMLPYLADSTRTVIISGGSGHLLPSSRREADITHAYIDRLEGVRARLLFENQSRNTEENIANSRVLVDSLGLKKVCVISSAMHIRRTRKILRKQGLDWAAYGVESAEELNPDLYDYFVPEASNLQKWYHILHEWIGYIVA